jgi:hypothetical protein
MSTNYSPSIESRARRLANKLSRQELLDYAESARKKKLPIERVLWRAVTIHDQDRSLMASLAATDYIGDAIYDLRPNGRLPSDGVRP